MQSESQLLIHFPKETSFHLIDLDTNPTPAIVAPFEIKPSFVLYGFEVTHSSNGLLLLEHTTMADVHRAVVCNPATGEYIILPESIHLSKNVRCAFLVCPRTHQFKVFRAFHRVIHRNPDSDSASSSSESDLFSDSDVSTENSNLSSNSNSDSDPFSDSGYDFLSDSDSDSDTDSMESETDRMAEFLVGGSDSWELLGHFPHSPFSMYAPCYLNDTPHWLYINEYIANLIVLFDFDTHEVGEIVTPDPIGKDHMYARDDMGLVVINGCLSILDGFTKRGEFHVWVMKEYGVWESWSKDFVIDTTPWGVYGFDFGYRPIVCRGIGEVVMIREDGFVLLYDLGKMSGRIMKFDVIEAPFNSVDYTRSTVSLRDAVRGGNMVVLSVASRSWSDEELTLFRQTLSSWVRF